MAHRDLADGTQGETEISLRLVRAYRRGQAALARPGVAAEVLALRSALMRRRRRTLFDLLRAATREVPWHVDAIRGPVLACFLVFWAGVAFGLLAVLLDPLAAPWLLTPGVLDEVQTRLASGTGWMDHVGVGQAPDLSGALLVHNVESAVQAIALGIFGGIGAVVAMWQNGVFLGAVTALGVQQGLLGMFLAFLAPHAVLELPAVWVAGGAGLALGQALLLPGRQGRPAALRAAASHAGPIGLALVPWLGLAALVEGFFSPLPKSPALTLAVTAVLALGMAGYLATAWRGMRPRDRSSTDAPA